jgi:HlyD family secretion protein
VVDGNATDVVVEGVKAGTRIIIPAPVERRSTPDPSVEWIPVERQELRFTVSGSGALQAERAVTIGPPALKDTWHFKIVSMVPEGTSVREGDPLIAFDPSELLKRLREEQANLKRVKEELLRTKAEEELEVKNLELQVENSRVQEEKTRNRLIEARQFEAHLKVQKAQYEAELAQKQVALQVNRLDAVKRSGQLKLRILEEQRQLHQHRLRRHRETIQSLQVKAPSPGIVIYETDWRNQKKSVGSDVRLMEKVLSLPDLDSLVVRGQVAEVDAGKLRVGQQVEVTLDALPDRNFKGRIREIGSIFQRASYDRPVKILDVVIELETLERRVMRPGMVAKLEIIIDRFEDVIAVPLSAIKVEGRYSYVWVRSLNGPEKRRIEVGQDNGLVAIIRSGLVEGEEVAGRPLEAVS